MMHFTIDNKTFIEKINLMSRLIKSKNTVEILDYAILSVDMNNAYILGNDLDGELKLKFNVDSKSKFQTLININVIKKALAKVDSAYVRFEIENYKQSLHFDSHITISIDSPSEDITLNDYPLFRVFNKNTEFEISKNDFHISFDKVSCAISKDETRYYLNGIFMQQDFENKKFNFVTTNGHMLAKNVINFEATELVFTEDYNAKYGIIYPFPAVEMIGYLKSKNMTGCYKFEYGECKKLKIISEDFEFTTKLIDGTFPDYNRVIPNPDIYAIFSKDYIKNAVHITSKSGCKYIKIEINNNKSIFTGRYNGFNIVKSIECNCKDEVEIGLNGIYLKMIIDNIDSDEVEIGFNKIARSNPIKVVNNSLTYVIMPYKLPDW